MWDAQRIAVDIDLDEPVILAVNVSVHVCASCSRMFRAQPPFLRPRASYLVRNFVDRLRTAGVNPDEVTTDDSRLYPAVLADVWPTAVHQLCLFHATRRVVRPVSDVIKQVRRALPTPPPASKPTLLGRLREMPPADDQHDADSERYRWRLARRTLGIARVHALHQHVTSARAIGRQLGINHGTVRQWLKLPPPDPATLTERSGTPDPLPELEPPPLPWQDWDEVRSVQEDLRLYRTLFLHRAENLTTEEHQKLTDLLAGPVGAELRVARASLEEWFAIWGDDLGNRQTPQEAERRYQTWLTDAEATKLAPLRREQQHLNMDHFHRLSAFLQDPKWECTNNAAERGGRAFRHGQHPHFRLRLVGSTDADLKVRAFLKKERFCSPSHLRIHYCQRGRRPCVPLPTS